MEVQNMVALIAPTIIDLATAMVQDEDTDTEREKQVKSRIRFLISYVVCILLGIIVHLDKIIIGDIASYAQNQAIILITAQTVFHLYWKKSAAQNALKDRLSE